MPIGPYIVDFLCRAERLVVEVDDGSHDLRWRRDEARTAYLAGLVIGSSASPTLMRAIISKVFW